MAAPFQWSLNALETLMAEDQMDQHAAVLRAFSVVELWRLRRVCRTLGDGEAFDPGQQTWQPLPSMAHNRSWHDLVAVAGGMLVVGSEVGVAGTETPDVPSELFDEASERWFELPHPMAHPRRGACVVSLPATALTAQPAAEAAAAPSS